MCFDDIAEESGDYTKSERKEAYQSSSQWVECRWTLNWAALISPDNNKRADTDEPPWLSYQEKLRSFLALQDI